MSETSSTLFQHALDRLRAGDGTARQELLASAYHRLQRLARAMLKDYHRLRRWHESDDVLQSALLRLHRALDQLTPATPRDFFRLAALQVRRELLDLARHYFGPEGLGAKHESVGEAPELDPSADSHDPRKLAAWAELHEQAGFLPDEEREVFDLLWYQGLEVSIAAEVLGVSERTVKRRWQAACLRLHQALGGEMPGL